MEEEFWSFESFCDISLCCLFVAGFPNTTPDLSAQVSHSDVLASKRLTFFGQVSLLRLACFNDMFGLCNRRTPSKHFAKRGWEDFG